MATLRATSQLTSDSSAGLTTTPTLSRPAGTTDGDYLLAMFSLPDNAPITGVPAGWALLYASGSVAVGGGEVARFYVYGKTASGEPASWTWTVSAQMAFYNMMIAALSGVNTVQPYEQLSGVSAASQANGSSLTRTATTTIGNDTLATIFFARGGADPSFTENAGTEIFDNNGADATDRAICLNLLDMPTPGTQGVTGTANNNSAATMAMAAVQLALLPTVITAGKSLALPYGTKALAGKSLVLPYTQIGVAAKSLALPYIVRVFSPVSLGLPYVVRVPLGRSLALVYPVRVLLGHSLVMPYGLAFAVPIPGKSGSDTYSDGASSPFGLAVNEASDLSIFATFVSIPWYPPEGLEEMYYGRLPHFEAQAVFELSPIDTKSVRRARAGWHGTKFDRERGSFAIVSIDGPLSDLVGERLLLTFSDLPRTKSIFVYVHDEAVLADDADISLPRREFLALALPYVTTVDVNVEVAG